MVPTDQNVLSGRKHQCAFIRLYSIERMKVHNAPAR